MHEGTSARQLLRARRRQFLFSGLGLLLAGNSHALAQPEGAVILSISGRLGRPNRDGRAVFDMEMLAALTQHSITQKTPWFTGPRKFTGPLLRDVLDAAGAQGQDIEAVALNDYKVTIPMSDVREHGVLLARLLDGKPMSVRDKGPLFIIYPFDHPPKLRSNIYYSRSAWQLKALVVR